MHVLSKFLRVPTAKVFHRDLKPKNILANSDCKLKVCDFGLARPSFNDMPTTIFWTDYVATRWYRAPELCGSFFAKYSPAIDIWSIGCIFAEILQGKPLFPGRNVVHQLELITDLLGTPAAEVIDKVCPVRMPHHAGRCPAPCSSRRHKQSPRATPHHPVAPCLVTSAVSGLLWCAAVGSVIMPLHSPCLGSSLDAQLATPCAICSSQHHLLVPRCGMRRRGAFSPTCGGSRGWPLSCTSRARTPAPCAC